jgi:hypothetical protein
VNGKKKPAAIARLAHALYSIINLADLHSKYYFQRAKIKNSFALYFNAPSFSGNIKMVNKK